MNSTKEGGGGGGGGIRCQTGEKRNLLLPGVVERGTGVVEKAEQVKDLWFDTSGKDGGNVCYKKKEPMGCTGLMG